MSVASKINSAPGTPKPNGIAANTIGTAPRNPAIETNAMTLGAMRNGARETMAASGRAKNTNSRTAPSASGMASGNRPTSASKPNITKRPISAIQDSPSEKPKIERRCGSFFADPIKIAEM